ncbi:MAG TPA: crossover junction endodeoxyribonuclease RuvC [Candidatus Jorgensenbacteria bacterium]|uniref:Uncharacterized protein n=1 Tax=marine sediment metagenome TaxID=412755 RepID=A0A0F9C3W8_9ZZZZ|nr:crossover junction endodeoxyribonuclease RuvC [Candidatus Jorgensenbacteria bacterium]
MVILGIDPGTTRIGYGVIIKKNSQLFYQTNGVIETRGTHLEKLISLSSQLSDLITKVKPELVGIETILFSVNKKTAISVAQARGVILHTVAVRGIPITEPSPSEVKLAVTGNGNATKEAVAKMVHHFLNDSSPLLSTIDDAMDALAIAITISNKKPS